MPVCEICARNFFSTHRSTKMAVSLDTIALSCCEAAEDVARHMGARSVSQLHLLYAIAELSSSARVLAHWGISTNVLADDVAKALQTERVSSPTERYADQHLVMSDQLQILLQNAIEFAVREGCEWATLTHLAQAILDLPADSLCAQIFNQHFYSMQRRPRSRNIAFNKQSQTSVGATARKNRHIKSPPQTTFVSSSTHNQEPAENCACGNSHLDFATLETNSRTIAELQLKLTEQAQQFDQLSAELIELRQATHNLPATNTASTTSQAMTQTVNTTVTSSSKQAQSHREGVPGSKTASKRSALRQQSLPRPGTTQAPSPEHQTAPKSENTSHSIRSSSRANRSGQRNYSQSRWASTGHASQHANVSAWNSSSTKRRRQRAATLRQRKRRAALRRLAARTRGSARLRHHRRSFTSRLLYNRLRRRARTIAAHPAARLRNRPSRSQRYATQNWGHNHQSPRPARASGTPTPNNALGQAQRNGSGSGSGTGYRKPGYGNANYSDCDPRSRPPRDGRQSHTPHDDQRDIPDPRPAQEPPRDHDENRSRHATPRHDSQSDAGPKEKRFYLEVEDDIVDGPSIGPKTAARLYKVRLNTVRDLLECDPQEIAPQIDARHITADILKDWQDQARLVCVVPWLRGTHAQILVGAGYRDVEAINAADKTDIMAEILKFAATSKGQSVLRSGDPPDLEKVLAWIEAAQQAELQRAA